MKAFLVGSVMTLAGVAACCAQQTWHQVSFLGPTRAQHAMAYDSVRGKTVLFSGQNATTVLADTWEWDGSTWNQVASSGPPARVASRMVFDSQRQRVVLFGGHTTNGDFQDTWEWDGTAWHLRATTGPVARFLHAMAFDSTRGVTVLFGGVTAGVRLGDTWEWNGTAWTPFLFAAGPVARHGHAMVFDSHVGRTVLFGGSGSAGDLNDLWQWDGTNWMASIASGPSPRIEHTLAYDSNRRRTVLFSGNVGGAFGTDTWEWDGTSWGVVDFTGPAPRANAAMVYDSQRWVTVLVGGEAVNGVLTDTWERGTFLPSGASSFGAGCGPSAPSLSPIASSPPRINSTARAALTNLPSSLAFVALGLSNTTFGSFPLPVTLASVGMPGCNLWQSAEVVGEAVTLTGPTSATFAFAIPNNPAFVGMHLYLQGWAWAPGANPANIIVSNGLDWQIGY